MPDKGKAHEKGNTESHRSALERQIAQAREQAQYHAEIITLG